MKKQHKQTKINIDGDWIEVDTKLAVTIDALVIGGFYTQLSCQDNGDNKAWLCFNETFGRAFMQAVLSLHCKQTKTGKLNTLWNYIQEKGQWSLVVDEDCVFVAQDEVEGTGDLEVCWSLRYPKKDIRLVEAMIVQLTGY